MTALIFSRKNKVTLGREAAQRDLVFPAFFAKWPWL
jgi:hypothetical protein